MCDSLKGGSDVILLLLKFIIIITLCCLCTTGLELRHGRRVHVRVVEHVVGLVGVVVKVKQLEEVWVRKVRLLPRGFKLQKHMEFHWAYWCKKFQSLNIYSL